MDKVYLDILGNFVVEKGISSKNPKPPSKRGDFLELATIHILHIFIIHLMRVLS